MNHKALDKKEIKGHYTSFLQCKLKGSGYGLNLELNLYELFLDRQRFFII